MAVFPISYLRDDFENNVIDPAWSTGVTGSATAAETGGQAVLTLPSSVAGTHTAFYLANAQYDLTGDQCAIGIGTMVATGVAATAALQLYVDANNIYKWTQTSGTLKAQKIVAGTTTDLFSVAWSATTHKYLRIRESGGTVFFDTSTSASAGAAWTNRGSTTIAAAFAVTSLFVQFFVSCGNIASPGSLRLDMFNLVLPTPSRTWRWTDADWQITNRLRPITLASSGNKQGVLVTAGGKDASSVLTGTLRYFAGPLGSASGGYAALTEYASLVLAQANPFDIPLDGRVDLPALVDCRIVRLYHSSDDGASGTLREFVPRRIVQADDIEAESIRAINIAAHVITADQIGVVNLDATAQITAGAGVVTLNDQGITVTGTTLFDDVHAYLFKNAGGDSIGGVYNSDDLTTQVIALISNGITGRGSQVTINANAVSGQAATVLIEANQSTNSATIGLNGSGSGGGMTLDADTLIAITAPTITVDGILNPRVTDAVTAATTDIVVISHNSSGTPAANFGSATRWRLESSTTADQDAAQVNVTWATATHASRKARVQHYAYDTAAREVLRLEASGTAAMIGFLGAAAVARPTVTGSKAANAALASALTALASLGLITDSST